MYLSRSSLLLSLFSSFFRPRFSRHLRTALTNAETMHDLVITSYTDHSYALSEESICVRTLFVRIVLLLSSVRPKVTRQKNVGLIQRKDRRRSWRIASFLGLPDTHVDGVAGETRSAKIWALCLTQREHFLNDWRYALKTLKNDQNITSAI